MLQKNKSALKTDSKIKIVKEEIFQGFVGGGGGFRTVKGYNGKRLETQWSKQILDSFVNDDVELLEIALQSTLADVHDKVIGGEFGTPLSIGEYGFYSKSQFDNQRDILKIIERGHVERANFFLSDKEWEIVDKNINIMGEYGVSRFMTACPGDTFASLAVSSHSYSVAAKLLNCNVDPLIENFNKKNLGMILGQQYALLTLQVKTCQRYNVVL